jgi:hypothetical protein
MRAFNHDAAHNPSTMTSASPSLSGRLRQALCALVALAALSVAIAGPAADVETPFQPPTAMAVGTELECPQADLTQPGVLCPDPSPIVTSPSRASLTALAAPMDAPPPSPPLRPPRA